MNLASSSYGVVIAGNKREMIEKKEKCRWKFKWSPVIGKKKKKLYLRYDNHVRVFVNSVELAWVFAV